MPIKKIKQPKITLKQKIKNIWKKKFKRSSKKFYIHGGVRG